MDELLLQTGDDGSQKVTVAVVVSSLVAISTSFAFGCAAGYSSPAESGIVHDFSLSTAQVMECFVGSDAQGYDIDSYSLVGSLLSFGALFGSILCGQISDFIGRKGALWFTSSFIMIGWLAISFAKDVWWLYFGRLLLGFCFGVQSYASVIYVAEIIPKNIRGGFTMGNQLLISGGITAMFSIGNILSWRALALIGIVPCIIQFIGLIFIPESPRMLAKHGRHKEVESSLQWLRGKEADISQELAEIQHSNQASNQQSTSGFKQLLDKRYVHPLIVGVGLPLLLPWSGVTALLLYVSSVAKVVGCDVRATTTTLAFTPFPFSVLGALLMDKFGRRPLLIVNTAGVCLGSFLVGVGFLLQELQLWANVTPTIVFIGLQIYVCFYSFGAGLPFVIISEIFPMNIKSRAGSLAVFGSSFNTWIVAYAFNFLFKWNSAGTFFIFSGICVLLIIFIFKMLPETKCQSLEEIEESWAHKVY